MIRSLLKSRKSTAAPPGATDGAGADGKKDRDAPAPNEDTPSKKTGKAGAGAGGDAEGNAGGDHPPRTGTAKKEGGFQVKISKSGKNLLSGVGAKQEGRR